MRLQCRILYSSKFTTSSRSTTSTILNLFLSMINGMSHLYTRFVHSNSRHFIFSNVYYGRCVCCTCIDMRRICMVLYRYVTILTYQDECQAPVADGRTSIFDKLSFFYLAFLSQQTYFIRSFECTQMASTTPPHAPASSSIPLFTHSRYREKCLSTHTNTCA